MVPTKWDVVILGGGFAGLACARRLEKLWGVRAAERVLLVSSENYFVFQPFLPEVVGASVEPRHVINPIRFVLRHCRVQRAEAVKLNLQRRLIEFDPIDGPTLDPIEAGHLVIALGSSTNLRSVPGMMEHGLFIKTLADALTLREHIVGRLEEASLEPDPEVRRLLLHFVVVGGGYSGVETAGEVLDLLRTARRFYRTLDPSDLRVTLVHSGPHLLPELGARLGRFAHRTLEQRGMAVILNSRVSSVGSDHVRLKDGTRIETRNAICTIGNAPHPVLAELPAEYSKGWIVTDEYLRVKGYTDVWAIGDAVANPDGYGNRCPPTAQFASRLGTHVATNLVAAVSGAPLRPFRYKMVGQMATIGHHKGVCSIYGFRFSGFFAWWLTRTIHLLKLPRLDRRLRVVIDWTLELFFPPDLNHFNLHKTQKMARVHIEAGDVVFRQGERGRSFYIVEEGTLEATQYGKGGEIIWRETLSRGDHFGEGALLGGVPRRATVVAKTPTTLVMFGSREFRSFVEGFSALHRLLRETSLRVEPEAELVKWPEWLLSLPVSSVMKTPVLSLRDSVTLGEVMRRLAETQRSTLPLVDGAGKMTGLVTRTDFYRAVAEGREFDEPVSSVATREVVAFRPGQTVRDAARIMYRKGLKHAPVLDDDSRPVGVLSYMDLAEAKLCGKQPKV